ncbi:hypothetical protein OS493_022557 [Desmophyllum pertusum]|uniref:Fibronectin type-III domain-containing protein n=1 Tax=Desmophyllum pertusum TaxID=174260 RepID=A0A9X0CYV8_9CNID|nr:hypothetical protein OS493_022557 [Desmophyllum pertusum]
MVIQHSPCGVKIVVLFLGIFQVTESLFIAAPSNVTVYNKTSTSLQIYWTEVNGIILGYRIRHRSNESIPPVADSNSSLYNNSSLFVCKNQTSASLKDLEVYTYYWVEVRAFNNEMFGNDSTIKRFRTDEGVPTSPPLDITTSTENSTSITVSWGSVPKRHQRGEIIGYIVTITDHNHNTGDWCEKFNVSSDHMTITLVDLDKFTVYYVTVSARTSKGESNDSAEYKIQTAEDAPDDPPTNITISANYNINFSYITVRWGPVDGWLNGILRAYKLRWKQVTSTANHFEKTINLTSSHSRRKRSVEYSNVAETRLTNLSIYTNYSLEIAAVTVKEGKYSEPVYFHSPEGVPLSPPGDVTSYNTSSTTINVTWSRPEENTTQGKLLGYEVTYTPTLKNASATRRVMLCYRYTSFELKNLTIYTLYNITVAAFTRVGIGKESELKQTWSDEDKPGAAPQNVIAVSNTFSSIHVSWDPVPEKQRHGIIIRYEVDVYGYENRYQNVTSTENHTAEIRGLEMFVLYRIYVRAYTRVGYGKNSYPTKC